MTGDALHVLATHPGLNLLAASPGQVWAARGRDLVGHDREPASPHSTSGWHTAGHWPATGWRALAGRWTWGSIAARLGPRALVRLPGGAWLAALTRGLFRSDDGARWQCVLPLPAAIHVAHGGLSVDRLGRPWLAEYGRNADRSQAMHLWRSDDGGRSFTVARRFAPGTVRHLHFIDTDPYTGDLWLGTGDRAAESSLWRSSDGGATWEALGCGDLRFRAVGVAWRPDAVLWGTDAGNDAGLALNRIVRLDRASGRIDDLRGVQGPVRSALAQPDGTVWLATGVEGGANEADQSVHVWRSRDGDRFDEVAAFAAGPQPRRLLYGLLQFLPGSSTDGRMWARAVGLRRWPLAALELGT